MDTGLLVLGFVAQGLFASRFLVQWIASERAKRSIVPISFWFLSVGGGALLLVYAVLRKDPVFILGQACGLVIYCRNLFLIYREHGKGQSSPDVEQEHETQKKTISSNVEN